MNAVEHNIILFGTPLHEQFIPFPTCKTPASKQTPDVSVSNFSRSFSLKKFLHLSL